MLIDSLTEAGPGPPWKLLELSMDSVLLVSLHVLLPHDMGEAWETGGM